MMVRLLQGAVNRHCSDLERGKGRVLQRVLMRGLVQLQYIKNRD